MDKLAIVAILTAKPGKEAEVEAFLKSAQPLAEQETGTTTWYALKMGGSKFGIFDTFADDAGRNAHLTGDIAQALFAKADELFAVPPEIYPARDHRLESPRRLKPLFATPGGGDSRHALRHSLGTKLQTRYTSPGDRVAALDPIRGGVAQMVRATDS